MAHDPNITPNLTHTASNNHKHEQWREIFVSRPQDLSDLGSSHLPHSPNCSRSFIDIFVAIWCVVWTSRALSRPKIEFRCLPMFACRHVMSRTVAKFGHGSFLAPETRTADRNRLARTTVALDFDSPGAVADLWPSRTLRRELMHCMTS